MDEDETPEKYDRAHRYGSDIGKDMRKNTRHSTSAVTTKCQ